MHWLPCNTTTTNTTTTTTTLPKKNIRKTEYKSIKIKKKQNPKSTWPRLTTPPTVQKKMIDARNNHQTPRTKTKKFKKLNKYLCICARSATNQKKKYETQNWTHTHISKIHISKIRYQNAINISNTVGYTMRDIRYKWNEGPTSVGVSHEVSLPQFKVLGHRQRAMEISLTTGTCRRSPTTFLLFS